VEHVPDSDYIESAIYLARAGYPEYWDDAERYLRNHLLESQVTNVSWVRNAAPVDMQPRLLGSFSARSSPNRLFDLYHPSGPIGCCNAAGVRALHLAWTNGMEKAGDAVRVNLLFSRETPYARLETDLPERGRVSVTMKTAADLYLRIPTWARHVIDYSPGKIRDGASWTGPFHRIPNLQAGDSVTLRFPLARSRREWYQPAMKISYRTEWVGDTVFSIEPRGNCFPLYERSWLKT